MRLIRSENNELSSSASRMGAGNTKTDCRLVRISVFCSARRNAGSPLKITSKFDQPDQSLLPIPRNGW
nr:hypothetical protein [Kribbella sandramycini]